jgi:hypothetical protein
MELGDIMSKKRYIAGGFAAIVLACNTPTTTGKSTELTSCVKASDCEIGQACDAGGRCVAAISLNEKPITLPADGVPKVKVRSLAPYEVQTNEQNASAPTMILVDNQVASVPITELGIGVARIGMTKAEWFSVPGGEFVSPEPGDPAGTEARGISTMDGAPVVAFYKGGVLCQLSTKSDHTATLLGVRPGDAASQVVDKYGALSTQDPRFAEKLKGVVFRFTLNAEPIPVSGEVPSTAKVSEILVGTCQ